jgi:hypothetical protein
VRNFDWLPFTSLWSPSPVLQSSSIDFAMFDTEDELSSSVDVKIFDTEDSNASDLDDCCHHIKKVRTCIQRFSTFINSLMIIN